MSALESLGMNANQWQFLKDAKKYVEASKNSGRELRLESTERQFLTARDILARLNGTQGEKARRGILLADDVGLGKTTIAALVAWVTACAGGERKVRILAPNEVMKQRWADEMHLHVKPLQECARLLDVRPDRIKPHKGKLHPGRIQIATHYHAAASGKIDPCDLLVVDEAHRAKGESSRFAGALKKLHAKRILILTATPFSIDLNELLRMLRLVGAEGVKGPVREYKKGLDRLYQGDAPSNPEEEADRLARKAKTAVDALQPYLIRHGVADLKRELQWFGEEEPWKIDVPTATARELELILRLDRVLRVKDKDGSRLSNATNDARFHVGWQYHKEQHKDLNDRLPQFAEPARSVVASHLQAMELAYQKVGTHSKIRAVADAVKAKVADGEKIVVFCDHHATAEELTLHLHEVLPPATAPQSPHRSAWKLAWKALLEPPDDDERDGEALRNTFIRWLCGELIRSQTWAWFGPDATTITDANLADALRTKRARHASAGEIIADATRRLYQELLDSPSRRAVLRTAKDNPEHLLTKNGSARVLGICHRRNDSVFLHNRRPDTAIAIFNSPFGPDVLVATDALSEGIDLHRCCRHLVHYELDPSPIRAVQRNGRIRRVNSWAALIGQPIRYAYPEFGGTRDAQLVKIVKKRIDHFSILLGGVQGFRVETSGGEKETCRNEVIANATERLRKSGNLLRAREPGAG